MFRIGQREVTTTIFVIATLLALVLGQTPENVLTELIAPLIPITATFKVTLDGINARVSDGSLTPGSFTKLLKNREFIYGVLFLGVGILPIIGINVDEAQKQQYVEIGVNFVSLVLGPVLLSNLSGRGSGKRLITQPGDPAPQL